MCLISRKPPRSYFTDSESCPENDGCCRKLIYEAIVSSKLSSPCVTTHVWRPVSHLRRDLDIHWRSSARIKQDTTWHHLHPTNFKLSTSWLVSLFKNSESEFVESKCWHDRTWSLPRQSRQGVPICGRLLLMIYICHCRRQLLLLKSRSTPTSMKI